VPAATGTARALCRSMCKCSACVSQRLFLRILALIVS
jgi:hypothetical protein